MPKNSFFLLSTFIISCLTGAEKQKTVMLNESVDGVSKLKVNCDYSGGEISISYSGSDNSLNAYIQYDAALFTPKLNYEKIGRTGILDMENEILSNFGFNFDTKSDNVSSQLLLPEKIPVKLNLDIGMSNLELDLTAVLVSALNLDFGMGEGTIQLGKGHSPTECKNMVIGVGMGSLDIKNIGEFTCESMEFESKIGSLNLDFSDRIEQDFNIDISVGLGSVSLQVPTNVNVKFYYSQNILADVDLKDMVLIENDTYRNESYEENNPTVTFSASVGMGSLILAWKD